MKIIKNSGEEVTFNKSNIVHAVQAANMRVPLDNRFSDDEIKEIAKCVEERCKKESVLFFILRKKGQTLILR